MKKILGENFPKILGDVIPEGQSYKGDTGNREIESERGHGGEAEDGGDIQSRGTEGGREGVIVFFSFLGAPRCEQGWVGTAGGAVTSLSPAAVQVEPRRSPESRWPPSPLR